MRKQLLVVCVLLCACGAMAQTVVENPTGAQTIVQPAPTSLSVNNFSGFLYASQYTTAQTGFQPMFPLVQCENGYCAFVGDPQYFTTAGSTNTNEIPTGWWQTFSGSPLCSSNTTSSEPNLCGFGSTFPMSSFAFDTRGGVTSWFYNNPNNFLITNGAAFYSYNSVASTALYGLADYHKSVYTQNYWGAQLSPYLFVSGHLSGGNNLKSLSFTGGTGGNKGTKGFSGAFTVQNNAYIYGEHQAGSFTTNCNGLGDCLGVAISTVCNSGMNTDTDEGCEIYGDTNVGEPPQLFVATCTAGCMAVRRPVGTPDGGFKCKGQIAQRSLCVDESAKNFSLRPRQRCHFSVN